MTHKIAVLYFGGVCGVFFTFIVLTLSPPVCAFDTNANETYADPYDTYIMVDEDTVIRIDKFTGNTRTYTTDGYEDPDVLLPLDGGDILIIPGDLYIDG